MKELHPQHAQMLGRAHARLLSVIHVQNPGLALQSAKAVEGVFAGSRVGPMLLPLAGAGQALQSGAHR